MPDRELTAILNDAEERKVLPADGQRFCDWYYGCYEYLRRKYTDQLASDFLKRRPDDLPYSERFDAAVKLFEATAESGELPKQKRVRPAEPEPAEPKVRAKPKRKRGR